MTTLASPTIDSLATRYRDLCTRNIRHGLLQCRTEELHASRIGSLDQLPIFGTQRRKTAAVQLPNGRTDFHIYFGDVSTFGAFREFAKELVGLLDINYICGCPDRLNERTPESVWAATIHLLAVDTGCPQADRRGYIRMTNEDWLESNDPELWHDLDPGLESLRSRFTAQFDSEQFTTPGAGPILGIRCSMLEDNLFQASLEAAQWLQDNQ